MKKEIKELSLEQETVRDCPILYKMRYRPMTETCLAFGWEHGHGWDRNVQEASYELETLNAMFYPKHRVRIQMDQMKEKFGTFTGYFSVVVDHGKFLTNMLERLQDLSDKCLNHDFDCKTVVDVEPFDYNDVRELTEEKFGEKLRQNFKPSNVEYKFENGKYLEICHLRNYGKRHQEPTKNKIWWKLGNSLKTLRWKIDCFFDKPNNSNTRRLSSYLYEKASEIIRKTEEKCYNTCEECGNQIGTDWSPRCETTGWITYICDECAKKHNGTYYMNGNLMQSGKVLKSKKQDIEETEKHLTNAAKEV